MNTLLHNKIIKNYITRLLLSIIMFLTFSILIKTNYLSKEEINKHIFENNISFIKINELYENKLGNIIPKKVIKDNYVFSNTKISENEYEKYEEGVKFNSKDNTQVSLITGGIAVFIGYKDKYNDTVILQGNDGIEYWYGNLDNISIKPYDYIEKGTIIGETKDNYYYLVIKKDGAFLDYDKYIKEI